MKKATYSFLAIAALMAMSCLKTEEFVAPEENTPHLQTFTAVIPSSPDTKVSLDNSGKTEWKINDKILIHGKYTEDNITVTLDGVTNTISADGKTATFTADLSGIRLNDTPGDKYYAVYPAEAYDEYSSGRGYHANCFSNTNTLLLSGRYNEAGNSFVFLNVTGALSFTVDGSSFGGFDEFKLVGKNDEVVGYTHFVTRARSDDQTFHSGDTSGEKTSVIAAVNDDGTTLNYVYFPTTQSADTDNVKGQRATCVDFTGGFIIYFLNGGVITHQVSTSTPVRVERQGLVRLGDLTAGVKPYVEPEHHSSITGATDLSASQANCYVISAAGAYKFPALKGNSNESIGTVKGVEILWETYNNAESVTKNSVISKVDYEGSEVFFETPATLKPGNAVIAAKNAGGDILWSWHIWIPAKAIEAIGDYSVSKKYLMDRNLGALMVTEASASVNAQSFGMLYQFGRKDPFVSAGAVNSETAATVAGLARSNTTDTGFSMEDAIANPTVFAKFNEWQEGDANLWGAGTEKTIYDPCPSGYRIPDYDSSDLLWGTVTSSASFSASSDGWWKIGQIVFPMAGYCESGGGVAHAYDRSKIWSSINQLDDTHPQHGITQYVYDNNGSWAAQPLWGNRKRYAVSVRCVKIVGEVPEPLPSGATSVVLDGDMSDWATADAISNSGSINEWKYGSDAENLYFYFKITKSDIKDQDGSYNWRRYIYIALDTDNNSSTGVTFSGAGLSFPGCDAAVALYPFRGTVPEGQTYPAGVEFVNGEDLQGWTKSPADGDETGFKVTAFGYISGDYAYIEIGIPRAGIGSPATGTMNVQFSYSYNLTSKKLISIN